MPILDRTFVPANATASNRTPEHWLRLFGAVCVTVHLLIFIIILSITPIVPLPAFIDFASAASAQKSPEFEHDVTVTVRANGDVFLQSRPITMASLAQELKATRLHRPHEPTLRLRIDRSTPFGFARGVAVAAGVGGYKRFTVMVRPLPSEISSVTSKPIQHNISSAVIATSPRAPSVPARPLRLARKLECQPGNILAEKLYWLREDLHVRFRVNVDRTGFVRHAETVDVNPSNTPVAAEFAQYQTGCLRNAHFERVVVLHVRNHGASSRTTR